MKNKSYIIIIFLLLFLTGCTKNNEEENRKIKNIEQINQLDKMYYNMYEQFCGIELSKQQLITKIEENVLDKDENEPEQDFENQQTEENSFEITDIKIRESILSDPQETDWKKVKQVCEETQDLVIDMQIEMERENVDENIINAYKVSFDKFVNNIINEDKEQCITNLIELLDYSSMFVKECINDSNITLVKKVYYTSVDCLIFLELENNEKFRIKLEELKEYTSQMDKQFNYEEIAYIKQRVNNIISTIDLNYEIEDKKNTRLKLIMLIESIPNIETYVEKLTIK